MAKLKMAEMLPVQAYPFTLLIQSCRSDDIFFLLLNENICCDPSLELSQRDGSIDGSQNMFFRRNMNN